MTRPCSPLAHRKVKPEPWRLGLNLESALVVVVTGVVFDVCVCLQELGQVDLLAL
jgi:hypothetical protein